MFIINIFLYLFKGAFFGGNEQVPQQGKDGIIALGFPAAKTGFFNQGGEG